VGRGKARGGRGVGLKGVYMASNDTSNVLGPRLRSPLDSGATWRR
jgi:hypothetical protein